MPRQSVPYRAAADPRARGRRRSGAGDISEGVSRRRPFRAGNEPEGMVVHHPSQHGAKPRPGSRARSRHVRQRNSGSGGRRARPIPAPARFVETPETLLLRDTLDPDLKAAVEALPDAFRQAVWLRDVEEFSYAEIAQMLTIPVGTVMSRISRGRRMLFDRLTATRRRAGAERAEVAAARKVLNDDPDHD